MSQILRMCSKCGIPIQSEYGYCPNCGFNTSQNVGPTVISSGTGQLRYSMPLVSVPQQPVNPYILFNPPPVRRSWKLPVLLITGGLVFLLVVAGSFIAATTYKELGGLDLNTYCSRSLHYEESVEIAAGWYCSGQSSLKIDMTQACIWQYHNEHDENNITARTKDHENPYSWLCFDKDHEIAGIKDMDGYCTSQGYTQSGLDGKQTADDWYCKRPAQAEINMTQACIWQYNRGDAQAHKNDNNHWECRGLVILG